MCRYRRSEESHNLCSFGLAKYMEITKIRLNRPRFCREIKSEEALAVEDSCGP
jgi:hypothetical protein